MRRQQSGVEQLQAGDRIGADQRDGPDGLANLTGQHGRLDPLAADVAQGERPPRTVRPQLIEVSADLRGLLGRPVRRAKSDALDGGKGRRKEGGP